MDNRLSRRNFVKAGAATALSLAPAGRLLDAAGSLGSRTKALQPVKGGTVNCSCAEVISDISPYTGNYYNWLQMVMFAMYEPLIKFGNGGTFIPLLATSWSNTPDYKTWTFKIRQGVKFHTGQTLTSADVVYTLNQINSPTNPVDFVTPLTKGVWGGATAPDPSTVVVKLNSPLLLLQAIRWWVILPAGSRTLGNKLESESVGTGPFKLSNFVQGTKIELVANSGYWNAPKPYISNLNFVFLTDTATQIANFLSGAVNMLHDIDVLTLSQIQGRGNSKTVNGGLFFHWWEPQMLFGPLASTQARIALRHAFNRAKLNQVAWAGKGIDTWNPYDSTPYGIHESIDANYDINLARKLIKSAGLAGETINLNVLTGSPTSSLEAQVLVEDFQAAGLKSSIVSQSSTAWSNNLYTNRNGTGLYNNYGTLPFPYPNILLYLFKPILPPLPPKYPQSPIPPLYNDYVAALNAYQPAPLTAALKAAQRLFLADAAVFHTFLAYLSEIVVSNMEGLESTSIGDIRFDGVYFS
jgi:peptide/nickel transport system substrate-binding protein